MSENKIIKNPEQSIFETINLVQSELCKVGIGKDQENKFQKYKYRGIDDLYNAISPILSRNGLIILPTVKEYIHEVAGTTKNSGVNYVAKVRMEFAFHHIHNDQKVTTEFAGEAMDTSDKATNKAGTAAYKYMCIMAFNIPINGEDDDADNSDPKTEQDNTRSMEYKREAKAVDNAKNQLDPLNKNTQRPRGMANKLSERAESNRAALGAMAQRNELLEDEYNSLIDSKTQYDKDGDIKGYENTINNIYQEVHERQVAEAEAAATNPNQ